MKNTLKIMAIAMAVTFLFTRCGKNDAGTTTYFYVNEPETDSRYKLYIDGDYKGELPFITTNTNGDNDSVKTLALKLVIKQKKYWIEARNQQNKVMISGTIKLNSHSIINNCTGQMGVLKTPDLVVVDMSPLAGIQK